MLRECPMTPLRVPSSAAAAACRSSDRGREHGFGALRLPALRFVRTASGSARPRPRLQRHAPRLGGFIRDRGAPRSPRGHKNPRGSRLAVCSMGLHRIRCGSSCQWRGVCPRHRDCGDSGTGLRPFRRPRRRQPTTLPLAARWMAAPYHAVTRAARAILLAIPLPPLARRPILPPVTTRSPHFTPHRRSGSDRRPPRLEPHPSPRRPRAFAPVRVVQSGRHLRAIGGGRGGHGNAPSRARSGPREADRVGGAWRRCARNARSYRRGRPSRTSSSGSAAQRRPPESRGRIPGANTSETAGRLAGTMLRTDPFPGRWVRVQKAADERGEPGNRPPSHS